MRAYQRDLQKKKAAAEPRPKWVVIEPDLFPGEEILCVLDPAALQEAQAAEPGLVTYTLTQIDVLHPVRHDHELLKAVHRVKKHLGGWVREARAEGASSV